MARAQLTSDWNLSSSCPVFLILPVSGSYRLSRRSAASIIALCHGDSRPSGKGWRIRGSSPTGSMPYHGRGPSVLSRCDVRQIRYRRRCRPATIRASRSGPRELLVWLPGQSSPSISAQQEIEPNNEQAARRGQAGRSGGLQGLVLILKMCVVFCAGGAVGPAREAGQGQAGDFGVLGCTSNMFEQGQTMSLGSHVLTLGRVSCYFFFCSWACL